MTTATKGYKGHRPGSPAEKAHKLVDENPKAERKELISKIKKLGVKEATAAHWISVFNNWAKVQAAKKSAKKPAKAKAKAVKKKAKAKPAKAAASAA